MKKIEYNKIMRKLQNSGLFRLKTKAFINMFAYSENHI